MLSVLSIPGPQASSANIAPTASFTYSPGGLTVNFTDTSTDSDGTVVSWAWTFGDAGPGTSTLQHPSYSYAGAGTYTVGLTVTDNGGLASTQTTQQVTVSAPAGGSFTRMMRTRRRMRR